MTIKIIGAGLAGCEAAWQATKLGQHVKLYEMRPSQTTKAHKTAKCAELVCSNSLRGAALNNAVGLLKEELKKLDSLIMQAALATEVPAGGALAVDRVLFSEYIDEKIKSHPQIEFIQSEIHEIPQSSEREPTIIASGPLTSNALASAIEALVGESCLAFFDAISPIVFEESLDHNKIFRQSRYDKGDGDDYLNVPLNKEEYHNFIEAVAAAEKYTGNEDVENDSLEKLRPFEGCMPIEDMIERGPETLRFGPFKPKGLTDPRTGKQPHAVLQLRQDDADAKTWNMVGMQTRMKRAAQDRIFHSLPGLEQVEFVRYGSVHRNTFINSPTCLDKTLEFQRQPGLFFAGQITGVEGYVESTAGGVVAGINASRKLQKLPMLKFPRSTAIGSLMNYISEKGRKNFQPMNISFGLMPTYTHVREKGKPRISKKDRRIKVAQSALNDLSEFIDQNL